MSFKIMHNIDISHTVVEIINKLQQLMSVSNSDFNEIFMSVSSSNSYANSDDILMRLSLGEKHNVKIFCSIFSVYFVEYALS